MKKNYGEILKQAIKEAGYKQKDLAEKMGETPQNLSNWLNRNDLTIYNFVRICEAISINPADIIDKNRQGDQELDQRVIRIMKNISKLDPEIQADFYEHMV